MKLIIHAGIHRTGTSSLQDLLASNRKALLQRGILYPGDTKNHQQLAWAIKCGEAKSSDVLRLIQKDTDLYKIAILSAEDFCIHKNLSWLKEVSDQVSTSVHFYLRRQDHWVMSWYNQHIKWPFDKWKSQMSPCEFLECIDEFYWIDFHKLIQRWESILGRDAVHVSVLEKGQVEDVTEDFIRHIDSNMGELPSPAKRANNSMPVHLLEITRHLGLHGMSSAQRMRLIGALRNALPAPPNLPITVYSSDQRNLILERFATSNRQVALERFQREDLFFESAPKASDPFFTFPEISRQEYTRQWIKPITDQLLL